jgi:serine/threonine-protein kinase
MVGTAAYVAPEQIRGEEIDARTDVYGLGCLVFEALTGAPPYEDESDYTLMYAHLEAPIPRLSSRRAGVAPAVDDVLARAMAKDRAERYDSAGEAIDALRTAFGA